MYFDNPVLECDDCGVVIRRLSLREAQEVAINPYKFIVYCSTCIKDVEPDV